MPKKYHVEIWATINGKSSEQVRLALDKFLQKHPDMIGFSIENIELTE